MCSARLPICCVYFPSRSKRWISLAEPEMHLEARTWRYYLSWRGHRIRKSSLLLNHVTSPDIRECTYLEFSWCHWFHKKDLLNCNLIPLLRQSHGASLKDLYLDSRFRGQFPGPGIPTFHWAEDVTGDAWTRRPCYGPEGPTLFIHHHFPSRWHCHCAESWPGGACGRGWLIVIPASQELVAVERKTRRY